MSRATDAAGQARAWLRARIAGHLAPQRAASAALRDALPEAAGAVEQACRRLDALEGRVEALQRALDRRDGPFTADWTVAEAWARHPGVREAFAARHLPACDGCAVRFDETLGEVAAAYGFDESALLSDLNALISSSRGIRAPTGPL